MCMQADGVSFEQAYLVQSMDLGTMFGLASLKRSGSLGQLLQRRQK
jgi:hypothetical protein